MEGRELVTSPDGRWRWDGTRWVPNQSQQYPSPPPDGSPIAPDVPQPVPAASHRYVPGSVRAAYAAAFFGALALVQLILAPVHLLDASFFFFAITGGPQVDVTRHAIIDSTGLVLFVVTLSFLLCAVVAFCVWLRRVTANLPALGASELRFTPAWAVGWWFIPLANLVVPLLVMVEAWKASDPRAGATDRATRSRLPAGVVIPIWWAAWIVDMVWTVVSMVPRPSTDQQTMVFFFFGGTLNDIWWAVCFILTVMVVLGLDRRQARKLYVLLASTGLPPEPGPSASA